MDFLAMPLALEERAAQPELVAHPMVVVLAVLLEPAVQPNVVVPAVLPEPVVAAVPTVATTVAVAQPMAEWPVAVGHTLHVPG